MWWHHDFHGQYGGPPAYSGGSGGPGMFMLNSLEVLFGLMLLGGLLWLVSYCLFRVQAARQMERAREPTALEILRERFAQGQIDLVTFEERVQHVLTLEAVERRPYHWV